MADTKFKSDPSSKSSDPCMSRANSDLQTVNAQDTQKCCVLGNIRVSKLCVDLTTVLWTQRIVTACSKMQDLPWRLEPVCSHHWVCFLRLQRWECRQSALSPVKASETHLKSHTAPNARLAVGDRKASALKVYRQDCRHNYSELPLGNIFSGNW